MSSGLAWKLNRLRCMGPAEIAHRLGRAARMRAERWGMLRIDVPPPDLGRAARAWIARDARVDPAPYVAAAERIAAGRLDVFALEDADLGRPPRWNRDPKTGIEAPLAFGKTLDYRDARVVGDCKYVWEPSRHLQLVTLAQAHALTGDARYARALAVQLDSWIAQCPHPLGVHWSSALEAALRLVNWAIAWQLLGGVDAALFTDREGRALRARWLDAVYRHVAFVRGHYSLHSSANNHLVGELAGVAVAALTWPCWPQAADWLAESHAGLEREALAQNAPDGVNREQALAYQQWELDLLILPLLAAEAAGRPFSRAYRERIEAMLEYLASVMDVAGNLPMIGDADDGCVARLDPRPGASPARSLLATGAVLFGRPEFKAKAGSLDDKTRWLFGPGAEARFAAVDATRAMLPVRRDFPDGGYYILGCAFETPREIRLVADAGPLGYREIAAHGHADALAFTLSLGGAEMLVDPGTYAYHTEPGWRAYFRGTAAHNTVRVDGRDQSEQGGSFLWLDKAHAQCARWSAGAEADVLEAWHDGYRRLDDPVTHRRRIALDKRARRIALEDTLEMAGEHAVEIFFHCHEDCRVEEVPGGLRIARGATAIVLRPPALPGARLRVLEGATDPPGGWVSRRFDRKRPAPTVAWSAVLRGPQVLRTAIDCRADAEASGASDSRLDAMPMR